MWRGSRPGPPRGAVRFGSLRRTTPLNRSIGGLRGRPIDRYYIDAFLRPHSSDIRGSVLEIAEPLYTRRFGSGVTDSEVLHISDSQPPVTLVADLTSHEQLPRDRFDCIICTQTLLFIFEVGAAIEGLHRMLKPGGVLFVTTGGISQVSRYDMDRWGHYWAFTSLSIERLFARHFVPGTFEVQSFGNVLSATAMLYGLAAQELSESELNYRDSDYEVLIGVRAVKAGQR